MTGLHVIGKKDRVVIAASIATMAMLLGSLLLAAGIRVVHAALITEEEHWKYHIDRWLWDENRRRTYGLINPQIMIQNETADRLEGYIADASGTRLDIYDGEQVVHVRFIFDNGFASDWQIAGRVKDGYFAIDIPERYRDAESVRIIIGTNQYTVDNGTRTTPQTEVYINSAILVYRTNSTLAETVVTQAEQSQPVRSAYQGGSLIDWILSRNGLLPVRSSDSGK
ncbi:MAG TPA: hypothetical protein VNI77_04155 [Nitrososphaera sp.]|nr:hypothetical protein [Nitrososphaera sp.]